VVVVVIVVGKLNIYIRKTGEIITSAGFAPKQATVIPYMIFPHVNT